VPLAEGESISGRPGFSLVPGRRPLGADKRLDVWAGLDLGLRHDCDGADGGRTRWRTHRPGRPQSVRAREGGDARYCGDGGAGAARAGGKVPRGGVAFDPWMSIDLSQRLRKAGVNMVEVSQTANNHVIIGPRSYSEEYKPSIT
jgi:hypothetical protein